MVAEAQGVIGVRGREWMKSTAAVGAWCEVLYAFHWSRRLLMKALFRSSSFKGRLCWKLDPEGAEISMQIFEWP